MEQSLKNLAATFTRLHANLNKLIEQAEELDKEAETAELCLDPYPWNTTKERWKASLARWGYGRLKRILGNGKPFEMPTHLIPNPENLKGGELDTFLNTFNPINIADKFESERGGIDGQEKLQAIQEFKAAFTGKTAAAPNKQGLVEVCCYFRLTEDSYTKGYCSLYRSASHHTLAPIERFELLLRYICATTQGVDLSQITNANCGFPTWWNTFRTGQDVPKSQIFKKYQARNQVAFRIKKSHYLSIWLPESVWKNLNAAQVTTP